MQEFLDKLLQLAQNKKYDDIINLINMSDFRNDKRVYNIKKSVKKYCRMKNNSLFYLRKKKIELSDNIWQTYFECLKVNNLYQAYEIVTIINENLNNNYSNFYLILTYDLLKLNEKNYINNTKIESINSKILDVLDKNTYISNENLELLKFLISEKANLKQKNNDNCYLENQSLGIIYMINQLNEIVFPNKEMFCKFDYQGTNIEKFYTAMENGDYISAFTFLKMPDVFDSMKLNFDKTYPLLIFKLLKTLEYKCNKKYKPIDKYEKLLSEIESKNYLEALNDITNNKFENDYTTDIINLLVLKK